MRVFFVMAFILQMLPWSPPRQQPAVTFARNTAKLTFPDSAVFSTTINSSETVTDVELLYGTDVRTCSEVQALAIPEFEPARTVNVAWEWDMLESGALPPGTKIWWQWRVTVESGALMLSERRTITWLDAVHNWKEIEDRGIRLHYYTLSADRAREFLVTAINAMERLKADTGMEASGTIDLYLYANTKDMRDALLYEPTWAGAMAFPDHNKVVVGISENLEWTKRTEAHELTHVLTGNYTFTCLQMTPTWLEEGLAVYGEGNPDAETQESFETARKSNSLLSFRVLSAGFAEESEQASLSYSQSFYMVNYLIETYGREKINRLLKVLSQGTVLDDALMEVYGFDLLGFEKEWRDSVGVPLADWYEEALESTMMPTEVPTLRPLAGVLNAVSSDFPKQTRTPQPEGLVQPTNIRVSPVMAFEATGTPVPPFTPTAQFPGMVILVLCILGLLVAVAIVVVAIRAMKNKTASLSVVILLLGSTALYALPAQAEGLPAEATSYPQQPTATLFTPPPTEEGYYSDPEVGVSLAIPAIAKLDTSRATASYHFSLNIDKNAVLGHMFTYGLRSGESLEELAHRIRDFELQDVLNLEYLEDREIKMKNGRAGWLTEAQGIPPNDIHIFHFSLVTVRGFASSTTLMLYSTFEGFMAYRDEIDDLNRSLMVSAPIINGFSRDELLVLNGGESNNPAENDPATTRSSGNFYLVYSGLVTFNPAMELQPDLARSWEVNQDGSEYIFHLDPDAVFHNGRPVTAEDVVYSWERAAAPETGSETVLTYLGDIQGVRAKREGRADRISGLQVIDDHTLQVTLEQPVPYFLLKLTYPTGFVVDNQNVEQGGDWYRAPNGTGPYRLSRWTSRKEILYERFDAYHGEKPAIKAILIVMYQGTGLQLYELGATDMAGVAYSDLIRFTDPSDPMHNELQSSLNMCTRYVTMDVNQPPFDDTKVRQAFAMSVDKERYVRVITEGGAIAAKGLYPPALPGYDKNSKGLEFNPEKARLLLKESKYGKGELPEILFSLPNYGSYVSESVSSIVQMWEENLGIKIIVQNIDPEYYQDALDDGRHGQLISEGWCADYPDPENFADVLFHSGSDMNRSNYANPELDRLLEEARVEEDIVRRMEMYRQAEEIIVNDAPAVFWTHSKTYTLVKPYLKGYVGTPIGIPLERYLWIDSDMFFGD